MTLGIRVFTLQRYIGDFEANEVIIPGYTGQITVLNNHGKLITKLDTGLLRIKYKEQWIPIIVCGGFAEIYKNSIVILAKEIDEFSGINLDEATRKLKKATLAFNNMKIGRNKTSLELSTDLKLANARVKALKYLSLNII